MYFRLVTEYPASGGALASAKFTTVKLLRYVSISDYILMGCEFMYAAFILYYLVEEAIEVPRLHITTPVYIILGAACRFM